MIRLGSAQAPVRRHTPPPQSWTSSTHATHALFSQRGVESLHAPLLVSEHALQVPSPIVFTHTGKPCTVHSPSLPHDPPFDPSPGLLHWPGLFLQYSGFSVLQPASTASGIRRRRKRTMDPSSG